MKHKLKGVLCLLLILAVMPLTAGCSEEPTPYETNNAENYTLSIKFDGNGGTFTTNDTSVIMDSYNPAQLPVGASGKAELPLLSPDDPRRGEEDSFTAVRNGYFLAGWYTQKGDDSYSGRWDFDSDRLEVDPVKTYSAETPVLTLYAAWIPLFSMEFVDLTTGQTMGDYRYDPTAVTVEMPKWDEETGKLNLFKLPEKKGYTLAKAYYDAEKTLPIETDTIVHTGTIDYETGTASNSAMKVYLEWNEGVWYHIYSAKAFLAVNDPSAKRVLCADLDFTDHVWTSTHGFFSGEIYGNGHAMKNITVIQSDGNKLNTGLFGSIMEGAKLSDITFENLTLTVQGGIRKADSAIGLLAGTVESGALLENVSLVNSTLLISSESYFGVDNYAIGLVCGIGDDTGVTLINVTCGATGENPDSLTVTADGNTVTVTHSEE